MTLHTYLPQDRLRALARGETLPDRTTGSALFADISGFTPLTEGLRDSLGPRRGAEELTRHLDTVYTALITEIERYGGSVIGFAGDAVTCWFDEKDEGRRMKDEIISSSARATACAFALQAVMESFKAIALPNGTTTELALKVAVASGPARRFVVGDPSLHYMDALAGATVARTSTGEHLSERGDVLLDEATVNALGDKLTIKEWRTDDESNERFAVADKYSETIAPVEQSAISELSSEQLRDWLHKAQVDREQSFLTEFRPCAALFLRFSGIDYDSDEAEKQLDAFVRQMQTIVNRYEGTVIQLTIGDKGSYAYINFGALSTHEDDARRAVKTALDIKTSTSLQLQMGLTQGTMRVGAYGGQTRRTYGALSDEVNLAARLMSTALPGEILLGGQIQKTTANDFVSEPGSPLAMKGKAEPLPVFAVSGERQQRAIRLQEPTYALPMVGRKKELGIINDKLELALNAKGQVIGIVAEAGMGKSRLVAEVIRLARRKGFAGYGGACQSDAVNTPYQTWKSIWGAFFDVDSSAPLKKQMRSIEGEIEEHAPERRQAMPLLNVVLGLEIPDNDFTKTLEPQYRKSALRALLEDCLRAAAKDEPLLIVIEDLHWIDALSHDLLEELARDLSDSRVCFVLAYRPPQLTRLEAPRIETLPNFTKIELHELNRTEAESAIRAKLAQLYPARGGALPIGLVDKLMARAQGNPFYLEELLNYVRDRGLDPADLNKIELPDSLHTLILSRIDQLSEREKNTLRVASIVGRLFRAEWLTGYYPELGGINRVKSDLEQLAEMDIMALDTPAQSPLGEAELVYLFKHIVTHEVTYESLPFATRTKLHEQLAKYLETIGATADTIAFHYGRSDNTAKKREYYQKAADAAQKNFANDAAVDYYGKLLLLLKEGKEKSEIHLKRGQVLELMGKWNETEAESDYRAALDSAKDDTSLKASAQLALGNLNRLRGDYAPALDWLAQAKAARNALQDTAGLAQVLIETGKVLDRTGDYVQASKILNEGLALAREAGDKLNIVEALNDLGHVVSNQGDDAAAWAFYESSLALAREIGDKASISDSLNVMGIVEIKRGDYAAARALYEESLALGREMGDQHSILVLLHNLGYVFYYQGDYHTARALFEEILSPTREIEDKTGVGYVLLGLGLVELAENNPKAREHILHSLRLRQETSEQVQQTSSLIGAAGLALHKGNALHTAQLLGAVESALKTLNAAVAEEVLHFHAQTLAAVREQLDESAFRSAWEEGSRWSLEDAVALAMKESE